MLVVAELVEAGTGWSEQHNVPCARSLGRTPDRFFQGFGVIKLRALTFRRNDLRFDRKPMASSFVLALLRGFYLRGFLLAHYIRGAINFDQ